MVEEKAHSSVERVDAIDPTLARVNSTPRAGSTLSFHDINYSVRVKRKDKLILKDISGVFKPGMNAILGPTGSGKSSLLDILAARKDPHGLSGTVLIDGAPHPRNFKLISGYVIQDDIVMGTLSVRENLAFSAALRLPKTVSNEERRERVEDVISELGLTRVADSKIGTEILRGVSGGERRRTNVGMELIIKPDIIFLDEPTTGLDAGTADSVMHTLALLSKRGRTVIFSIHQPRYSIFRIFDHMHLLARGNTVYHGPARGALTYFSSIGYECESHNNPPDFFLDIINGEAPVNDALHDDEDAEDRSAIKESEEEVKTDGDRKEIEASRLAKIFEKSRLFTEMKDEADRIFTGFMSTKDPVIQILDYPTSFLTQLYLVLKRETLKTIRDPLILLVQYIVMATFALIIGMIYFDLDLTISAGIQNRAGSAFFLVICMVFGNYSAVEAFIKDRSMFLHESASGFYRVSAYYLSKIITDLVPLRIIPTIGYALITYWMIGFQSTAEKFFIFFLSLLLISYYSMAMITAVSTLFDIVSVGLLINGLVFVIMILFGGLLVNITTLPVWLQWLQYLSVFRYGMNALLINEMKDLDFCEEIMNVTLCVTGPAYLEEQGIRYDDWGLWQNMMAMAIIGTGLLILGYIKLRLVPKVK